MREGGNEGGRKGRREGGNGRERGREREGRKGKGGAQAQVSLGGPST